MLYYSRPGISDDPGAESMSSSPPAIHKLRDRAITGNSIKVPRRNDYVTNFSICEKKS